MVVWLRGGEDDFDLSAEEAMAELNIKRSRLTQISGRELRVGRRRVDRYIKPFYRRVDVQAYKDWTRAAVTRQRSAGAVAEVVAGIESQNKAILQETCHHLTQVIDTSVTRLADVLLTMIQGCKKDLSHSLQDSGYEQGRKILKRVESLQKNLVTIYDSWQKNILQVQMAEFAKLGEATTRQMYEFTNLIAGLSDLQATEMKKLRNYVSGELSSFQTSLEQHLSLVLGNYMSTELSALKKNFIADVSLIMTAGKKTTRHPVKKSVSPRPSKRLAWPSIHYP